METSSEQRDKVLICANSFTFFFIRNIVKVNCYLSDINEFHKMDEFYEEIFGKTKPARTTFEVGKLPINAR